MKGYEYVSYDAKKFYNIVPLVANLLNGGRVCPRAGLIKLSYAVLPKRAFCVRILLDSPANIGLR
jgi:hypothetical protein